MPRALPARHRPLQSLYSREAAIIEEKRTYLHGYWRARAPQDLRPAVPSRHLDLGAAATALPRDVSEPLELTSSLFVFHGYQA